MCTGFPRLGVLRRLRPAPIRSADDEPSPAGHAGCTAVGRDRAVPAFTVIRSTKEEPSSIPAASPRLPRSTSPWPPGPTPAHLPESSPLQPQARTGAHRTRPISARFEPVYLSRDVITLVPHVLLFITLAEPAPSGDPGTSRRCQGCSHPPRHLPDQAALSFTVPAATGPAVKDSHPHSNHQRLAAHGG
jgi:hypothetical protein